ncbi:MAG: hypothetical protein QNL01_15305 [Akkermansiaceae bacterium]|jgi:hypothetical protein|tara:strand:- start:480 stop:1025 length:546 start_codon:yes stop_codon:yes gene_type:complete
MIKYITILGACAVLTSCGSTGGGGTSGGGTAPKETWKKVPGVTNSVTGEREVMKASVGGKDVVAVLSWRDYSAKRDGAVTKWYGDMASPPPKFVVETLLISIDGKGMIVPQSKTRYMASQWMNGVSHLGLYLKGKNLCVYMNVGDGAESWTASYVVNPSTGALVSHSVIDGPEFHNTADGM